MATAMFDALAKAVIPWCGPAVIDVVAESVVYGRSSREVRQPKRRPAATTRRATGDEKQVRAINARSKLRETSERSVLKTEKPTEAQPQKTCCADHQTMLHKNKADTGIMHCSWLC